MQDVWGMFAFGTWVLGDLWCLLTMVAWAVGMVGIFRWVLNFVLNRCFALCRWGRDQTRRGRQRKSRSTSASRRSS